MEEETRHGQDASSVAISPGVALAGYTKRTSFSAAETCFLYRVPLSEYQRRHSLGSFKSYLWDVVSILQDRMERLRTAAGDRLPRSVAENERDEAENNLAANVEELLSAVLSAHLMLLRVALLYPWHEPFGKGLRAMMHDELSRLAGSLADAWDLLGVSGESRRQMLQHLIAEVGQQTLENRQQINKDHVKQLGEKFGTTGDVRGFAALRETEGEYRLEDRLRLLDSRARLLPGLYNTVLPHFWASRHLLKISFDFLFGKRACNFFSLAMLSDYQV